MPVSGSNSVRVHSPTSGGFHHDDRTPAKEHHHRLVSGKKRYAALLGYCSLYDQAKRSIEEQQSQESTEPVSHKKPCRDHSAIIEQSSNGITSKTSATGDDSADEATSRKESSTKASATVKSLRAAAQSESAVKSASKPSPHPHHHQLQSPNHHHGLTSVSSIPANQLRAHVARADADEITDLEELEQFAKTFKQRRIKLGKCWSRA